MNWAHFIIVFGRRQYQFWWIQPKPSNTTLCVSRVRRQQILFHLFFDLSEVFCFCSLLVSFASVVSAHFVSEIFCDETMNGNRKNWSLRFELFSPKKIHIVSYSGSSSRIQLVINVNVIKNFVPLKTQKKRKESNRQGADGESYYLLVRWIATNRDGKNWERELHGILNAVKRKVNKLGGISINRCVLRACKCESNESRTQNRQWQLMTTERVFILRVRQAITTHSMSRKSFSYDYYSGELIVICVIPLAPCVCVCVCAWAHPLFFLRIGRHRRNEINSNQMLRRNCLARMFALRFLCSLTITNHNSLSAHMIGPDRCVGVHWGRANFAFKIMKNDWMAKKREIESNRFGHSKCDFEFGQYERLETHRERERGGIRPATEKKSQRSECGNIMLSCFGKTWSAQQSESRKQTQSRR